MKTAWFMPSSQEYVPSDRIAQTTHPPLYPTGFDYENGHFGSAWDSEVGFYTDTIYANVGGRQHGSAALAGLRLITTF